MNCEECKNLISLFLVSGLDTAEAADVRMHLALCGDCARVCEEMSSFIDVAGDVTPDLVPPNSQALWCRINNIIENEIKPRPVPPSAEAKSGRFWSLSFGQLAASVLCIAIVSSLLTVVVVRSYSVPEAGEFIGKTSADRTIFDKVLGRLGLAETPQQLRERRMKEQQTAIDYWNARVQMRRLQWDRTTREAFDRNLQVIDQSVSEYSMILQRDPEDDLSGEMLDSVMDDKMRLLRDFSDL